MTTRWTDLDRAIQVGSRRPFTLLFAGFLLIVTGFGAPQPSFANPKNLPRFASLKSNPINLRKGPGTQYPKAWIFRRTGLPVEVYQEYQRWRRVRDADGATGWVLNTLLSKRRTALVLPWELKGLPADRKPPLVSLRSSARQSGRIVARMEAGSLVGLKSCDGSWCYVSINGYRGYVEQAKLWGVYPKETVR